MTAIPLLILLAIQIFEVIFAFKMKNDWYEHSTRINREWFDYANSLNHEWAEHCKKLIKEVEKQYEEQV